MDFSHSLALVVPELILSVSGLVLLLVAAWGGRGSSKFVSIATCVVLGAAFFITARLVCDGSSGPDTVAFGGQLRVDAFAGLAKLMIYAAAGAVLVVAPTFFGRMGAMRPEFPILVLFAVLGTVSYTHLTLPTNREV